MKIILASVGTRGDMEPFLALGKMLKAAGHQVVCLFPEQFRQLAEDAQLEFESMGSKFVELIDTPAGRTAMSGGKFGFKKLKAYAQLISKQPDANKELFTLQEKCILAHKPDCVVHHPKANYAVLWGAYNKGKATLISPVPFMHYVKGHTHVAFHTNLGAFFNKLSYKLVNYGLVGSVLYSQKWLTDSSYKATSKLIKKTVIESKVIYNISPSLFSQPHYWKANLKILGFQERNKAKNWNPSPTLEKFLQRHSKIVFVSFGSMINNAPLKNTETLLHILKQHNIPAIINTFAGGLTKPKNYDSALFYFVERIPYDWIFPKIYAVIHHGGSGTTQMGVKYGCATLILPHILDQYEWNKIIFEKGIGPLGIDISKLSLKNLEPKIVALMENPNYKAQAHKLSLKMQSEDYTAEILATILGE